MNITEDPEVLQVLGLGDLQATGISDYDNLSDLSIWALASAIEIAYQKGYAQGIEDQCMIQE